MNIESISNRFNRVADHSYKLASNKSFLAFAFVAGAITLPFSAALGLTFMAAPAAYAGMGLVSQGLADGLATLKQRLPSPRH